MGDIGDRLRALFDEEARPIDPTYIPHSVYRKSSVHRRFSIRPGWQIGIAAGVIALVFGGTALLLRTDGDGGTAEQTVSATQPNEVGPAASLQEVGIEWTQGSLPEGFRVHTITAAGGYFFGLAWDEIEEPDPRTRLWLSEDGANWEAIDVDATLFGMRAGYFKEIAALGDGFIAIVKGEPLIPGDLDQVVVMSTDARVWVPADIGDIGGLPVSVAGGTTGGIAVIRSQDERDFYDVWHSIDGATWTLAASQTFSGASGAEFIGGRFYLWPPGDGEGLWSSSDASEWTHIELPPLGADWSGRMLPAESTGGLLMFTDGASGSQLWLMAADNTWMEVTPERFDVPFASSGGFGDQFISSSNGGPAIIIDDTVGPGANEYLTTIWWTLDGALWTELQGSEAFGFEGTIRLASAKGNKIVVVYTSETDRVGSLWTGVVTEAESPTSTVPAGKTETAAPSGQMIIPIRVDCTTEMEAFPCANVSDGQLNSEWQVRNGGIGARISFAFDQPYRITEVGFTNLLQDDRFRRNVNIKGVEIRVDDQPQTVIAELDDENSETQWVAIDSIRTMFLTIDITSAYPGVSFDELEPFAELALAEISFRGSTPTPGIETTTLNTLPYLVVEVEGLDLVSASDVFVECEPDTGLAPTRGSTYRTGQHLAVMFSVNTIRTWCGESMPDSPSDLGPLADPPNVVDHGLITVMGTQARVVEQQDVYSVFWIVSETATAQFAVFPTPDDVLTLDEVIAVADGVIEITAEQWITLVRGSSEPMGNFPPATVPNDDGLLVLGAMNLNPIPDVVPCSGFDGGVAFAKPNQGGPVALPSVATPIAALRGFLSWNPGDPPVSTFGYWEIAQPDSSIVYAKPLDDDPNLGFVTFITVLPIGGGWSAVTWTASGC